MRLIFFNRLWELNVVPFYKFNKDHNKLKKINANVDNTFYK